MKNPLALAAATACLVLGALALFASSASATLVQLPNGHVVSIAPHAGIAPASIPGSFAARSGLAGFSSNGNLDYHGGPVVHSSAPYVIFWTPSGETISSTTEALIQRWFTDIAADSGTPSDVFGVDRQFTDGTGFVDNKQTFGPGQSIVDTQPYPAKDTANCVNHPSTPPGDHCITDTQLRTEIKRLISAGSLPTDGPTSSAELNANAPIYLVVLPLDVNECTSSSSCADNRFCAYHSSMTDGSNRVLYASIPLLPDPVLGGRNCQFDANNATVQEPNRDLADLAIKAISHEESETMTDPVFSPSGTGWWDSASGNEDGDNCNFGGTLNPQGGSNPNAFTPTLGGSQASGTLFNQLINGHPYYIQSEWSNGDVNCEMRPSAGGLSASFSVTQSSGGLVSIDPTSSASSNGYSSVSWSLGDGTTSFDNSGSGPAAMFHTYAPGVHTATLTLVDSVGNLSTVSHQVTVGASPHAAFTSSPGSPAQGSTVNFNSGGSSDADTGVTITYGWNFGDGSSTAGLNPSHIFKRAGTFKVSLEVADSAGHTAFVTHTIKVAKAKISGFSVKHKTKKGATLEITVNAPGRLSADGKGATLKVAGKAKLKLKLTKAQIQTLNSTGKLTLKIKVKFVPKDGSKQTKTVTIKFP